MTRVSVVCLLVLVATAGPASAVMCTTDQVPAATLLLPYFEVDLVAIDCVSTLFSVNNASAAPTVAHVTIWSDLSVPVLDFNIYLTGYDVQTINLQDVLRHGRLPVTAPLDAVSNRGLFSAPHDTFGGTCGTTLGDEPYYENPVLEGALLAHVQTSLTGQPSPLTGDCASLPTPDGFARGYITIDDANECSLLFPGDPGYFASGGIGTASNDNQLWGDFFLMDPPNDLAEGGPLVHVEAQNGFMGGPNQYTFYARYTGGFGLADEREPLATQFAVRHVLGGAFSGGTDLLVWRDSKSSAASRFPCGTAPAWYPLATTDITIFDEEENPVMVQGPPVSGIPENPVLQPFPRETQRVAVGGPTLPVPAGWEQGWLHLDLDQIFLGGYQPVNPASSQGWVTAILTATGEFSVASDALQLDTACEP